MALSMSKRALRMERRHQKAGPAHLNIVSLMDIFTLLVFFLHDAGTFSVLIVRLAGDKELADLRDEASFTAALAAIPAAATWTDPERAVPTDRVRAGAELLNLYRPQARGIIRLPGGLSGRQRRLDGPGRDDAEELLCDRFVF